MVPSEECHSSESGWTMYIGSPAGGSSDADADAAPSGDDGEDEDEDEDCYGNNQDESDDSMASDASSGPSHQVGHPFGGNGRVKNPNPHGLKQQSEVKFCFETKTKKPLMEKQRAERKEVKEKLVLVGQKPKTSVQSSSKVRKSIWMGKKN
ncbi:uncharacterized protein LOC111007289 isoform X2 [Momordica charantia]|uniref:Uncharacterized protein LOC111007289 isoform X2 n=1 Tax=Momordica charantia TaxID=3673 RepID=A0A6J1C2A7_MOMCH|nr:uncharacterized protein LOC111007289 isoform X2 [Momordica charantia]